MKKIVFLFLSILLISCDKQPIKLNVMTFNIRLDSQNDNMNQWPYRKDVAAATMPLYDVDIVGMQEVQVHQLNDLQERLPEYAYVGVGREDGKERGEFTPIFYKKERFELLDSGNFWLSETPEVAGSKGWDADCVRVATWAILKEKKSNEKLFFINTHLDHIGKTARQEGVTLLLKQTMALSKGLPAFITADFNATPNSNVIQHVLENGTFFESKAITKETVGNDGTFHNYGAVPIEKRKRIDFIFVSENIEVSRYEVIDDKRENIYLSDHNPVIIQAELH